MGTQNWMSALPNNIKLSRLTIPETHESCSRNLNLYANCQDMDLASQLNA